MADLDKARVFMNSHARLLDRRRFDLITGDGSPDAVLDALTPYRNPDGGFGWALHPDLRSVTSQPVAAMHVFEILEESGADGGAVVPGLCDWLESATLPDGGLPFALPFSDAEGSAPLWEGWDSSESSLLMTSEVCALAHRLADRYPALAEHPWLERATGFCLSEIASIDEAPMAITLKFSLDLLDALHGREDSAPAELERLGAFLPESAMVPVTGGAEGEAMRPLDFAPVPGRPVRALVADDVIAAALDELAAEQDSEGGWNVDFEVYSPAAELEWRGEASVRAFRTLKANGVGF